MQDDDRAGHQSGEGRDASFRLPYGDRSEGGRALADALRGHVASDAVVLALPRGGVPVAFEVAREFRRPLDVFIVRKLGVPGHVELAMGAIASGGTRVINEEVTSGLEISQERIDEVARRELVELERRERLYRGDRGPLEVEGRHAILVDDGLATGSTMRAAARALRKQGARHLTVGVPVAPPDACEEFRGEVDDVVCAATPEPFRAVGIWYRNFSETTDDEVRDLLNRARAHPTTAERT